MASNPRENSDGVIALKAANTTSQAMSELARRGSQSVFTRPPSIVPNSGENLVKAAAVVAPAAVKGAAAAVAAAPALAPLAAAAVVGGGVYGAIKLVKWLQD